VYNSKILTDDHDSLFSLDYALICVCVVCVPKAGVLLKACSLVYRAKKEMNSASSTSHH